MHGWLVLDKPVGLGSTQAVSAVKRALRVGGYAKARVGHGGTLDPLASGVLPIAIGEATKLAGRMLDADKAYDFTLSFGVETTTLDAEGAVAAESPVRPTLAQIIAVLPRFTGPIAQTPPAFSALKIDGKRAYDLARAGEEVVLASRDVTIHSLCILPGTGRGTAGEAGGRGGGALPLHQPAAGPPPRAGEEMGQITLSARVSKGTYIRSLARDIAYALGTVGHVTMLRRTKAGPFTLESAISLDILDEAARDARLQELLLPLQVGLVDIPVLCLTPDQATALRQGRRLTGYAVPPGPTLAMLGETPVALVDVGDEIKVVRGFNLMSE
ncbi:tRNA pseudouridine(55) synthase TruB [Sphingomonas nostoxanthinifaciens]|uniref:tRNA pseudouridine(55) synthase TruB n=1 Tax=Sphingomonas nostoxanthinifaciens TaxID=2872652 RepID=UPI001CC21045|nr:tRNA pseudouridine(55) synthase TruB [Sphingomonas nostoxanthinifaciens]UAK26567.1 tRNA pseudouridine(55) synthase TruB [Sphingomonas nostoxanthinifaciens]